MQDIQNKKLNEINYQSMDDNYRNNLLVNEYSSLIEELRIRLNIVSTSVFLLEDNSNATNQKQYKYLNKIKVEMEKIRILMTNHPKDQINRQGI